METKPCESAVIERVFFRVSFKKLAALTVLMPLTSLLICFVTAMIFQNKEVNTTFCDVYNIIPSISAITGISPQRYIWRIGVALHCTPRLLITSVYYSYYVGLVINLESKVRKSYLRWVEVNYWLNVAENLSLIGVTYISNRENYPIHEKLFIVFMSSSLSYMLLNCIIFRWGNPIMSSQTRKSYLMKLFLLSAKLVCTVGLLYFFYRHRRFCEELGELPLPFVVISCFSFCEYCMATANMAYHATVVWDCPDECIIVGAPVLKTSASNPGKVASETNLPNTRRHEKSHEGFTITQRVDQLIEILHVHFESCELIGQIVHLVG
uniref:CWH43-like N-terminal domain-containing protein n=1 Tax=Strigamia maritima TaxID=126957 RepID=T1JN05_STRMM